MKPTGLEALGSETAFAAAGRTTEFGDQLPEIVLLAELVASEAAFASCLSSSLLVPQEFQPDSPVADTEQSLFRAATVHEGSCPPEHFAVQTVAVENSGPIVGPFEELVFEIGMVTFAESFRGIAERSVERSGHRTVVASDEKCFSLPKVSVGTVGTAAEVVMPEGFVLEFAASVAIVETRGLAIADFERGELGVASEVDRRAFAFETIVRGAEDFAGPEIGTFVSVAVVVQAALGRRTSHSTDQSGADAVSAVLSAEPT